MSTSLLDDQMTERNLSARLEAAELDCEQLRGENARLAEKVQELEALGLMDATDRAQAEELHDRRSDLVPAQRELDSLSWVGRIREALDDDRMVLYSQRITPLSDRAEGCEELLVRMIGETGDVILPGSFIPTAERYGQIGEIDQWVITQTARLASRGPRVCANLSAGSIGSLDLLTQIERALAAAGTDPANVGFEITETALMENIEAGEAFARGIAEIGCSLALDDFGTGYGSFIYLQKLQIAFLKIDVSFVRDLVSSAPNQHLVKAIVSIARGLGQQTIAEGVENGETLDLLRELGVDLAQGFHLGRPHPIAPEPWAAHAQA